MKMDDHAFKQTAVSFLTSIPLTFNEACSVCSQEKNPELVSVPIYKSDEDEFTEVDVHPKTYLNATDLSLPHKFQYKRSVSSIAGVVSVREKPMERQLSLIETRSSMQSSFLAEPKILSYPLQKKPVTKISFSNNYALQTSRIFLVESMNHTPCAVFSILPYFKDGDKSKSQVSSMKSLSLDLPERRSINNSIEPLNLPPSNQVVSYQSLLSPTKLEPVIELDCAEWTSGKHRTVLEFGGYTVSVIGYTKPSELKRNLNVKFKQSFPGINLTLSKLRSLERSMHRTAKSFGIQTGVLSCAKSYFERLVFSCVVNKVNRQPVAATCLLLSAKIHGDLTSEEVSQLVTSLEHAFDTSKSTFLRYEFPIFAALKFSIMLPTRRRTISGD